MAKRPEKLKFTGYGRSYCLYSTIPRNHEETTTTVTSTEDCQTQTHFDRVSSPGSSADTQISLTGSDRAISRSPQEQTESKRLDYCSRCYEETTTANPRNEVVTEKQVADISDEVGTCWRQLGPRLKIAESKIHNIDEENRANWNKAQALLIVWKQKEGKNATVGHLADVLEKIGRRSIAEKLLGESRALEMPSCAPVSVGDKIDLTVNAIQDKVLFCEGAHGNIFIVKAIDTKEQWNSEKILKNKEFLEKVAAAAQDMEKTEEQKLQDCLVRYSAGIEELKKEMQDCSVRYSTGIEELKKEIQEQKETKDKDDDDYDDGRPSAGTSSPEKNTQQSDTLLNDVKVSLQDATQLLQYCEEHKTHYNGIYNNLIKKVEEVAQLREDNFMCVKHLCDSIKEIKDEEKKTFNPKLKRLHDLKQHLDRCQVTQVEELYKWSTVQKKQLSEVEKLLSSLLNQGNQCHSESSAGGRSTSSRKGKAAILPLVNDMSESDNDARRSE